MDNEIIKTLSAGFLSAHFRTFYFRMLPEVFLMTRHLAPCFFISSADKTRLYIFISFSNPLNNSGPAE